MERKYWALLALGILIMIGYTYSLDIPQEIQTPLQQDPYNFTTEQFNLIYFSTFILVTFLVIPIGIGIDRFPTSLSIIVLLALGLISQTVIGLLLQERINGYIGLILLMRSLFGISGEGLITLQGYVISVFGKKQYQFLMGLCFAIPYIFDSLSSIVTTTIYQQTSQIPITLYIGSLFCLISLFSGFFLIKYINSQEQLRQTQQFIEIESQMKQEQNMNEIKNEDQGQNVQKGILYELKSFPKRFWILIGAIFVTQCTLAPFFDNLNDLLVKSYGVPYIDAGKYILIPYSGLAIMSIIIGKLLKIKPTLRRKLYVASSFIYLGAFLFLYMVPNTNSPTPLHFVAIIFFLIAMAFTFSVYFTCLTSSIPYLVHEDSLGTAWGVCGSVGAFAQSIIPLINTLILKSSPFLEISYERLTFIGTLICLAPVLFSLYIYSNREYNVLDQRLIDEVQEDKN